MKNILVVSLGGSPAVVTETLWALERREDDPFWPDRLVIVTTSGAQRLEFLAETDGGATPPGPKLRELAAELGRPLFDLEVIVARRPDGGAVEDIRDEADAIAFGDAIAEVARQATLDDDATLHLSIAGGRKTMSYHAGAAMTLYGRARDELSHVLVAPSALEQCPEFWWPSAGPSTVKTYRGAEVSAHEDDVTIDLILTPFYRARGYLPDHVLKDPMNYGAVVRQMNAARTASGVRINLPEKELTIAGYDITLRPAELAMYAVFAEQAMKRLPPIDLADFDRLDTPTRARFDAFRALIPAGWVRQTKDRADQSSARGRRTNLMKQLERQLGKAELLDRYGLIRRPGMHKSSFAIIAAPEEIEIITERPA